MMLPTALAPTSRTQPGQSKQAGKQAADVPLEGEVAEARTRISHPPLQVLLVLKKVQGRR
jgi:hypothetical protein